jgi:hypothetical protein
VVHEAVLQIDNDVRRVARAQAVKYRDATTAEHDALAYMPQRFSLVCVVRRRCGGFHKAELPNQVQFPGPSEITISPLFGPR